MGETRGWCLKGQFESGVLGPFRSNILFPWAHLSLLVFFPVPTIDQTILGRGRDETHLVVVRRSVRTSFRMQLVTKVEDSVMSVPSVQTSSHSAFVSRVDTLVLELIALPPALGSVSEAMRGEGLPTLGSKQ